MKGFLFGSARRLALSISFAALVAGAVSAQSLPPVEADSLSRLQSSPRHGEWVSYDAGMGDKVDAWVVYPERADKAPVVVVIHEIFGLTDWARAVADQYAAEGFIAIAPDFLTGKAADMKGGSAALGPDGSRAAIAKLDPAEIVRRLDGAAAYATSLPAATKAYGVVGFCWGGAISFAWATQQPKLGASVVYYGTSPAKAALAQVQAPVLGLYGGTDARVNATIPDAKAELDRLGKRYETEIYEGAGHAFLRQQAGMDGANLKAAQAAWPRSVRFLKDALEAKSMSSASTAPALLAAFSSAADCADFCVMDEGAPGVAMLLPAALATHDH